MICIMSHNLTPATKGMDNKEALSSEAIFFRQQPVFKSLPSSFFGVPNLTRRLTDLLVGRIKAALPNIKWEVRNTLGGIRLSCSISRAELMTIYSKKASGDMMHVKEKGEMCTVNGVHVHTPGIFPLLYLFSFGLRFLLCFYLFPFALPFWALLYLYGFPLLCFAFSFALLSLLGGTAWRGLSDSVAACEGGRAAQADGEGGAEHHGRVPHQSHEDRQRLLQTAQTGEGGCGGTLFVSNPPRPPYPTLPYPAYPTCPSFLTGSSSFPCFLASSVGQGYYLDDILSTKPSH